MTISASIRRTFAAGSAALLAIALVGCVSNDAGNARKSADATLNLAIASPFGSWNPAVQINSDSEWVWHAVYDTLLQCDRAGQPHPGAARTFTLSDGNRVLDLTLRKGMTFQDGTPIDAQAVKASIEHFRDGGGPDSARVAGLTVEATGDLSVRVLSPTPRQTLASTFCLPAGIVASPAALSSTSVDSKPISSGPYVYDAAKSSSGSVYTFTKRSDYWDSAAYPHKTIVIKAMADVTARLNALKSGQINAAELNSATDSQAQGAGLTVDRVLNNWSGLMIVDRGGKILPALGDVRVRQAINMVFDREAILKGIFQGQGEATEQVPLPDNPAYEKSLNSYYSYDVAKAKQLMDEAGYSKGFSLEIPSWPVNTALVNPMIIQQLGLLNIRATEVPLTNSTAIAAMLSGRFPIIYWGGFPNTRDPMYDVETSFKNWNYLGASNPTLTTMLAKSQTLHGDQAIANFRSINEFWVKQAWFAPFIHGYVYTGLSSADLVPDNTGPLGYPQLSDFK